MHVCILRTLILEVTMSGITSGFLQTTNGFEKLGKAKNCRPGVLLVEPAVSTVRGIRSEGSTWTIDRIDTYCQKVLFNRRLLPTRLLEFHISLSVKDGSSFQALSNIFHTSWGWVRGLIFLKATKVGERLEVGSDVDVVASGGVT